MKRHPILAGFSRDHHHALITARYIKKDAPTFRGMADTMEGKREYVLNFFKSHLQNHFRQEEEILFSTTGKLQPGMQKLLDELIAEHSMIVSLIQRIENQEETESALHDLGSLLESHIRKEERELFQQMQDKLSPADFLLLEQLLQQDHK